MRSRTDRMGTSGERETANLETFGNTTYETCPCPVVSGSSFSGEPYRERNDPRPGRKFVTFLFYLIKRQKEKHWVCFFGNVSVLFLIQP